MIDLVVVVAGGAVRVLPPVVRWACDGPWGWRRSSPWRAASPWAVVPAVRVLAGVAAVLLSGGAQLDAGPVGVQNVVTAVEVRL